MPGKQVREVYVEPVGDLKLLLGGKHGYMRVRGGQGLSTVEDMRLSALVVRMGYVHLCFIMTKLYARPLRIHHSALLHRVTPTTPLFWVAPQAATVGGECLRIVRILCEYFTIPNANTSERSRILANTREQL